MSLKHLFEVRLRTYILLLRYLDITFIENTQKEIQNLNFNNIQKKILSILLISSLPEEYHSSKIVQECNKESESFFSSPICNFPAGRPEGRA